MCGGFRLSYAYTYAKQKLVNGTLDTDSQDIRIMLVMTNTTADTEQDVQTITDAGALEYSIKMTFSAAGRAIPWKVLRHA